MLHPDWSIGVREAARSVRMINRIYFSVAEQHACVSGDRDTWWDPRPIAAFAA
jgi:hypothetical protein